VNTPNKAAFEPGPFFSTLVPFFSPIPGSMGKDRRETGTAIGQSVGGVSEPLNPSSGVRAFSGRGVGLETR
jgi:hypothetical protein